MRDWDFPPAITDLSVAGDTVSWWQDDHSGGSLVSVAEGGVARPHGAVAQTSGQPLWTVIDCTPGPAGIHAVVVGRPGADYGYLCCVGANRHLPRLDLRALPVVRRPTIVWASDGASFVYPRLGVGIAPDQAPPDGIEVAVHRVVAKFHADRVVLPRQAAHSLVTLEPSAEEGRCVLRVSDGRHGDYYLLDYATREVTGPRVSPLVRGADARTQVVVGRTRWWVGTGLGTAAATLLAMPPGRFDLAAAQEIGLRVNGRPVHPVRLAGSGRRLAVRTVSPAGELVLTVDAETLRQNVVSVPDATVPELAASVTGSVVAWSELTPGRLRVRALADGADAPATHLELDRPTPAPVAAHSYLAEDGTRLPLHVSRGARATSHTPVVVLAHGGTSGLANDPLERALEHRCVRGELVVVRAVTRTLGVAADSDGGRRAYDDLLAAARTVRDTVANRRRVALIGIGMDAVGAARAVLIDPDVFGCVVLRFPVADLIRFPELGTGRHWVSLLGDPAHPDDHAALETLSPCHLRSSGAPIPPVLVQVGRFDSRAHPQHGRRLFGRLNSEPGAAPALSEFAMGHVARLGCAETVRGIEEVVRFVVDLAGTPRLIGARD